VLCGNAAYWVKLFEYKSSAVAEMGDRLATMDRGRKLGVELMNIYVARVLCMTQCSLLRRS